VKLLSHFKQTLITHILDHIHERQKCCSLCKAQFEEKFLLDLFFSSLTSKISKDVENSPLHNEAESINKAQQLEIIYT